MKNLSLRSSPKNALGVISLFVGIVELAFAYPLTTLTGFAQNVVLAFMVGFPVIVLFGFFFVLIRFPENFYSPADFENPELFTQLVTRRDARTDKTLKQRNAQLETVIADLKSELSKTSPSIKELSHKIDAMPQLNQNQLEVAANRLNELIEKIDETYKKQNYFPIEPCWRYSLMGIQSIWFDMSGNWSLGFVLETAIATLNEIGKRNIIDTGGNGSIHIEGGDDYNKVFSYELIKAKYGRGMVLTIKYDSEYCTVC